MNNDTNGTVENTNVPAEAGANQAPTPEEVTYVSTGLALKSIGHNVKVKTKDVWTKAKPKLKKAGIALLVIGGAAYAYDKITSPNDSDDGGWTDDNIVDGEGTILGEGTEAVDSAGVDVTNDNGVEEANF